jgi:hypothetical protein
MLFFMTVIKSEYGYLMTRIEQIANMPPKNTRTLVIDKFGGIQNDIGSFVGF